MFDGGWIGWVFLRALNGAHATSENSKQIRVLRKKTLCSPWLRGGIKFNRTVRNISFLFTTFIISHLYCFRILS